LVSFKSIIFSCNLLSTSHHHSRWQRSRWWLYNASSHINWLIYILLCPKHNLTWCLINYIGGQPNFKPSVSSSITSGGSLILNQAFPRALLPLSSAISAARQFFPTIPIYILIVIGGKLFLDDTSLPGINANYLLLPVLFVLLVITSFGLSLLFATMNVYFRDTTKLLSYIMRIWLYASPVLWQPDMLNGWYRILLYINPLGPILSANSRIWIDGLMPTLSQLIGCLVWAVIAFTMGAYFFISRERDFAVRI